MTAESRRRALRKGNEKVDYGEKEESDLDSESVVSESRNSSGSDDLKDGGSDIEEVWLHDDLDGNEDVALDSDDDETDLKEEDKKLNDLLEQSRLKLKQERQNDDKDSDDDDSDKDENMDSRSVSLKLKKLNEFVTQSRVYSGVIADTLFERSKQRQREVEAQIEAEKKKMTAEPPKKKTKTRSIVDFFKPKTKEEAQPSALLEDSIIAEQQPSLLKNCILKPYQLDGLNWLITLYENGLNGILADDMGLGKTIQSIALLAFIYEMDTKGPFLIAVPLSTIDNWVNEFSRFAPDIPKLKYYHQGGARERIKLMNKFFREHKSTGVVITSYEMIIRDSNEIMSRSWKFLIVDEGHRLKNINCKLIQELKRVNTRNKLLLTGTPLQNNLAELWSLLNFIMPDIFSDFEIFNKWFDFRDLDLQNNSAKLNKIINDELEKNLISNLHTILKPFLLRRLKKVVLSGILPPKREYIVNCPLTPIQRKFYNMGLTGNLKKTILKEMIKSFFTLNTEYIGTVSNKSIRNFINYKLKESNNDIVNLEDRDDTNKRMEKVYQTHMHKEFCNIKLQNMIMQLRQIVDSTYLFYFPFLQPKDVTLEQLLNTSGKLKMLQRLVIPLCENGHKVLIFSQFVRMLDLIEDWCDLNSLKTLRIDGSVDNETRKEHIDELNSSNSKCDIFLLSTRAAGLGINLIGADTVVLFDSDWNPQVDLQAMDRCHRIGQDKPVIVYRLCCDNTVEHVILTRAANKRRLEKLVIQMGQFSTLKKLALNEGSFLQQKKGAAARTSNKDIIQELSRLLVTGESSIGFASKDSDQTNHDEQPLTEQELLELMDRSPSAYDPERTVELPHVCLFETTAGEL